MLLHILIAELKLMDCHRLNKLNQNTWGVKKVRGQEEQVLISNKAKKSVNESAT